MDAKESDIPSDPHPGFARLTRRELDCLRALRQNGEAKLAARALSISLMTFNEHLAKARKKLGVGRSWDAARLLAQWEAAGGAGPAAADAASTVDRAPSPGPDPVASPLDRVASHLGPWSGPLLVVVTAAALALAALAIWATAELALRFQDLK
jgi:DNA-binding CsgD family transcriptional regulator